MSSWVMPTAGHIGFAVLVAHLHGSQLIEILLLHIEGVHISARDAQLLG